MERTTRNLLSRLSAAIVFLMLGSGCSTTAAQYGEPRFDAPALDAMLAPIALYPDPLLSHVLMAATYPNEVQEAAAWLRARPGVSGDAAVRSSEGWDWDPSVRSLLAFPLVLDTLAEHSRWTAEVGEAFLVQRDDVMDSIQQLRRRAYAAGALRSNETVRVVDTGYAITIEPLTAQTVYVPYYDPRVTYGTWWWPTRPPMHWPRWSGYYHPAARDAFVVWGPGIHISSGFFFGSFAWSRREVRVIDVHPYYYPRRIIVERPGGPGRPVIEHRIPAPGVWSHDTRRRHYDGRRHDDRSDRGRAPESGRRDYDRRDFGRETAPPPAVPGRSFDDRRLHGGHPDARDQRRFSDRAQQPPAQPARVAPHRAPEPTLTAPPAPASPSLMRQGPADQRVHERSGRDRDPSMRGERRDDTRGPDRRSAEDGGGRGRSSAESQRPSDRAERPGRSAVAAPPQQPQSSQVEERRMRSRDNRESRD